MKHGNRRDVRDRLRSWFADRATRETWERFCAALMIQHDTGAELVWAVPLVPLDPLPVDRA